MKRHEYDDLLPEEVENQDFIRQVELVCQVTPEDAQAIGRLRERWLQLRSTSRTSHMGETLHAMEKDIRKEGSTMVTHSPSRTKPWMHTLNQVAAILVVSLLVGILVTTFALIEASKGDKQQQPATGAAGQEYCVGHSGVVLTEGLRLAMVSSEVGWAIGDDQSPYGSLLRTNDGGRHWQNITLPVQAVAYLYILNEKTVWLPVWPSGSIHPTVLYRTVDAGASWQRFNWPTTTSDVSSMTFVDQDHGWIVDMTPGRDSLLHTSDGGKTWQKVGMLSISGVPGVLQFCNQQTGWISAMSSKVPTTGMLYVTHDGGRSWKQQPLLDTWGAGESVQPRLIRQLVFIGDKTGYLLADGSTSPGKWNMYLYITQDGGKAWVRDGGVLPANTDERTFLDIRHISGDTGDGSGNNIIVLITLEHEQWVETRINQPPMKGGVVDYSFTSVQTGVALGAGAHRNFDVYRTSNGGKTWQKVGSFP